MISVVHKLSQKAAAAQTSSRKSSQRATNRSTSPNAHTSRSGDTGSDVRTAPESETLEAADSERVAQMASAHTAKVEMSEQTRHSASSISPTIEQKQVEQSTKKEHRQEVHVEAEGEVAFGAAPTATEDAEADEAGGILFGAAQPEEEEILMFGAPVEATEKQQSTVPAAESEKTVALATPEPELSLFERHCRLLRQPGYPAGELEVRALAEMLNCASVKTSLSYWCNFVIAGRFFRAWC